MPYLGNGLTKFTTADDLTVNGDAEVTGTVNPSGDTAAGDAAALGFTSAEGLILTGQGSTSDITVKNDADATVFTVPTGTDDILFPDSATIKLGSDSDAEIFHNGTHFVIRETNTSGNMLVRGDSIFLESSDGSEQYATFNANGAVVLKHDNTTVFSTASTGIDITGGFTATDGCTITTADNTAQLTIKSTDADASGGPFIDLVRDSSSPAANDIVGLLRFRNDNSAGDVHTFGLIQSKILDATDGSEDMGLEITMNKDGTNRSRIECLAAETVFNEDSVDLDFRVETDNDDNAFFIQGNTGDIGISTNSPSTFSAGAGIPTVVLQGNSSSHTDRSGGLVFVSQDGGSTAKTWMYMDTDMFIQTATNSDMRFYTGNTERMKILAGGNVDFSSSHILLDNGYGINFSATSDAGGMTSEILDDYEEGTWTASVEGSGGGTAQTMSGYYTKVGNKVYVHASAVSGLNMSGMSGQLVINGLPFTAKASGAYQAFHLAHNNAGTFPSGRTQLMGYVVGNTQIVSLVVGSGVGWNDFAVGSNTSAGIIVSGTYEVA